MKFDYKRDLSGGYFPVIMIRLGFGGKVTDTSALIDSGATISIFKKEVADDLNIKMETGEEIFLGGVGGRIKGYINEVKIGTAGKTFISKVIFSNEYLAPFNLLGRSGFFENFRITFDEKNRKIELK